MNILTRSKRAAIVALAIAALTTASVVAPAAPASAAACYESSTITSAKSISQGVVTFSALVQWRKLYNCSNVQIGVRIIRQEWSYQGGYNGSGHGIQLAGANYKKVNYTWGDPVVSGSVKSFNYTRTAVVATGHYLYGGTVTGTSYSFTDAATYAYFVGPHSDLPQAGVYNVWYHFQTGQMYWAAIG